MAFNSLEFLIFLLLFLAAIRWLRSHQVIITLFSYVFYAFGDSRYFPLLLFLGIINYFFSYQILRTPLKALFLTLGLGINLAALIWGKMNFGQEGHLPLGLSFYTFQAMSFFIDLNRGTASLPHNFWHFQAYLFFFPQLLAGPICRAQELIPKLSRILPRPDLQMLRSGLYLLSFGLFKKAVIADAIGNKIDEIFNRFSSVNDLLSWSVIIVAYGWQIYFDFSGYTDMARGMAKLIGISLPLNFSFPYKASSPREFWQRWHMSLSSWFRDYVYIPLGGSRHSQIRTISAILITFLLSSLWHGLGWNYILWGCWHAFWLILFSQFHRGSRALTLFVIFFGWFFFRARDEGQLIHIFQSFAHLDMMAFKTLWPKYNDLIVLSIIAFLVDWGAAVFRKNYRRMNSHQADAVWILITLAALLFQAPLIEFIYFRF